MHRDEVVVVIEVDLVVALGLVMLSRVEVVVEDKNKADEDEVDTDIGLVEVAKEDVYIVDVDGGIVIEVVVVVSLGGL